MTGVPSIDTWRCKQHVGVPNEDRSNRVLRGGRAQGGHIIATEFPTVSEREPGAPQHTQSGNEYAMR